jgi:ABC-type transport system involved in Fe-S cluster assembly fused permease/ATPase subunit
VSQLFLQIISHLMNRQLQVLVSTRFYDEVNAFGKVYVSNAYHCVTFLLSNIYLDGETDAFIQTMLRTKFSGSTQITVAHRLNTIMDFDYILVMDKGKTAEMGPPSELLKNDNGLFSQLVDATGAEGSKALRAMVTTSPNNGVIA